MAVVSARSTLDAVPLGEYVPTADQRLVMYGLRWDDFETFLALRGQTRPRVTYLEGTLELMSPSKDHEVIKTRLATVVEAYLVRLGVAFEGVGEWLIKHASSEAGLEPDECYIIGDLDKDRPDLAIEVVWSSGGLDKLEIYRRLGVGEVWIWRDDALTFHVLVDGAYEIREQSRCVPAFDVHLAYEIMSLESLAAVHHRLRERLG